MSVGTGQFSEAERLRLREVADAIDRELSCLGRADTPEAYQASASKFAASWAEMLEVLALGPAPDMRVCHRCGHLGRRAATRCGYCWAELPPLAPIAVRH